MPVTVEQVEGQEPVTVIEIHGDLDYSNYMDVIDKARDAHAAGARNFVIDLSDMPYMGSSGLFALHSVALLTMGEEPPDPESGWNSYYALDRTLSSGIHPSVKLVGAQPSVDKVLERTGMKRFFEIHPDRAAAIGSF
jgi:anti-anti-sigma regulatory factor